MGVYSLPDGKGGQVNYNFDMGSKKVLGPNGEELTTFQRYPNGQFGIVVPKSPENPNGGTLYLNPTTGVITSAETGITLQGSYAYGSDEQKTVSEGPPGNNTAPATAPASGNAPAAPTPTPAPVPTGNNNSAYIQYDLSFTDPNTNQPVKWNLMSDGTVSVNGIPTYRWTRDSAGEYYFTDNKGNPTADYINGNIVFPSPKSSTANLPFNPSDTKETVSFDSGGEHYDWAIKKDNTVWDNATNKQIGTYANGHFSVTMPDDKIHQVDWEEGSNTLDIIGDNRGNATNVISKPDDVVGTITAPDTGAKWIFHTDGDVTVNGNSVGKFTDDGTGNLSLYDSNGTPYGTYNKGTGIYTAPASPAPEASGSVASTGDTWSYTDANGNTHYYYFNPTTQTISDSNGKTIGKYTTDPDTGAINISGLDGTSVGKIDPDTGTITWTNGSSPTQGSYSGSGLTIPKHLPITSNETSKQNQTNNTTGTTTQNTNQKQTSGIDWSSPVAKAALPQILQQMQQLPGLAKTAGTKAQDIYKKDMVQAMSPAELQGALNSLAGKGMVNSTVGQNTLANTEDLAAKNIGNKAFNASLANTEEQMKVPQILSGITSRLGNRATGTTGTNTTNEDITNTLSRENDINKIIQDPERRFKLITSLMT